MKNNRFPTRLILMSLMATIVSMSAARAADAPSVSSSDTPQTIVREDFEIAAAPSIVASAQAASSVATTEAAEVVAGKRSLKGDSRGAGSQWNEFFHSRPGLLKGKESYSVAFDFKVLWRDANAQFYVLARRGNSVGNGGWKEWRGEVGERGHIETAFATGPGDDYELIIGIQNGGAMTIDNLVIQTDPANRPLNATQPAPMRTWKSPGHTAYYVDALSGNDANPGTSSKRAWRTLNRINSGEFAAGDRILLRAGSRWNDFLAPGGRGQAGAPIVVDRYGRGPKPKIDAAGKYLSTLYLHNVEQIEVRNLDIANQNARRQASRAGVWVQIEDFGTAHHIHLLNLDIHDVNGSLVKSEGGNGIYATNGGSKVKSRFDDLRIEGCHLQCTDRNGITMGGYWARNDWYPSLRVVIRHNLLEDIGGDGIVPIGCEGALVEHNVLRGGRMRAEDYAAGIWPWSCDNTTIQWNEVSGMKGTKDGQGFDSDWNCRNTLIQYNYSHDNDGGFLLICNDGTSKLPFNIGNIGTIVRYNISQNDGERTFNISGPVRDTAIYNNTIYIGPKLNINIVTPGDWGGDWPEDTRFWNNVFYVEGQGKFDWGGMRKTVFENNAFQGRIENRPPDANAIVADAKLSAPGTAMHGFDSLPVYRPRADSPLRRAGKVIPNNGGHDFGGRRLPTNEAPTIGAWETH